jgi:hypothetical protein
MRPPPGREVGHASATTAGIRPMDAALLVGGDVTDRRHAVEQLFELCTKRRYGCSTRDERTTHSEYTAKL